MDYITLEELGKDSGVAQFFDDVAEKLHDRAVYDSFSSITMGRSLRRTSTFSAYSLFIVCQV